MASLPRTRRHRSSTTKSGAPPFDTYPSIIDPVLQRLLSTTGDFTVDTLDQTRDDLVKLSRTFVEAPDSEAVQDYFRRAHGFQTLATVLRETVRYTSNTRSCNDSLHLICRLHVEILRVLLHAFREHEGNRRYFTRRVSDNGWTVLRDAVLQAHSSLISALEHAIALQCTFDIVNALLALALGDDQLFDLLNSIDSDGSQLERSLEPLAASERPAASDAAQLTPPRDLPNPEALVTIACLYKNLPRDQQWSDATLPILTCLDVVLGSSFRVRAASQGFGLASILLSCLFREQLSQEDSTWLTSICRNLMCTGIENLEDVALLVRQATKSAIARDLLQDIVKQSEEPCCIQFDLSGSGHSSVELPALPRVFPAVQGYTLITWFRVDEFDSTCHTTIFGAFDASQTCFVLVYLEKDSRQLILQTSVTSSRPSVRFKNIQFKQGIWYHVALVHRPAKSNSPSQADLYVNGRFVESKISLFPQVPPPSHGASSGAPFPPESSRRKQVQAFLGTPQDLSFQPQDSKLSSRWSLASAHLYDGLISRDIIAVYHGLGPTYNGNYQDHIGQLLTYRASAELNLYNETLHPEKAEHSGIGAAIQQQGSELVPESRLLLSISAASVTTPDSVTRHHSSLLPVLSDKAAQQLQSLTRNGNAVLFNTAKPLITEALSRVYGAAVVTGNAAINTPKAFDNAIWQLGGGLSTAMISLECATTAQTVIAGVDILFRCIQDSWRTSEVMEKDNGYGVIALLIRQKLGLPISTSNTPGRSMPVVKTDEEKTSLALALLNLILEFVGYNVSNPERSILINPMAYRVFLVDFDTFRVVAGQVQKLYYQQLAGFIDVNIHTAFNTKRLTKMRKFVSIAWLHALT